MPVSGAVRRLLRVRDLIEEQYRIALESAVGELHRLERALEATRARARAGRKSVAASARSGDVVDRIAGLADAEAAKRRVELLVARVAAAELEAGRSRQEFLEKRLERRQAETLIREQEAQCMAEAARREQQRVDDWFGSRAHARDHAREKVTDRAESRHTDSAGH